MYKSVLLRSLAAVLPLGLAASPVAAVQIVNDTFDSPNYGDFFFNAANSGDNPDDNSFSAIGDTLTTGGNPGSYLELFHFHDVARDEFGDPEGGDTFTSLQSFLDERSVDYIPSTQGEIQSLSFSLDYRTTDPFDSVFFTVNDENGGNVAGGFTADGFFTPVTDGTWQTVTFAGVTQAEVGTRDLTGSVPLDFGFGFTSDADVFDGEVEYQIDVDNFVVTATLVPEPTAAALLVAAAGPLLARQRRGLR
jgi:hypothetical protein